MNDHILPFSGYILLEVDTYLQHYTRAVGEDELKDENRLTELSWDWMPGSEHEFSIWLSAIIRPSKNIPERVAAAISGNFSIASSGPRVPFETFVCRDAPLLIFPYLRELVSELTKRGQNGAYYIPIAEITQLIEGNKFEKGSGLETLRKYPELGAHLGISLTIQAPSKVKQERSKKKTTHSDND